MKSSDFDDTDTINLCLPYRKAGSKNCSLLLHRSNLENTRFLICRPIAFLGYYEQYKIGNVRSAQTRSVSSLLNVNREKSVGNKRLFGERKSVDKYN